MLKKIVAVVSIFTFLFSTPSAFAQRGGGRDFHGGPHGGFHGEPVVHRLPPGYVSLMVGGLAFLYCEGLFYRYTPAGYIIVEPPPGAVVPALPAGYTTVFVGGRPYYYYGYTYYASAPGGYVVAAPQAVPVAVPPPAVPVAPVSASVPAAPQQPTAANAVGEPAKTEEPEDLNVYDIYIPNGNGSYTVVTLKKTEKGFLGPQGEFYEDHPTVDQLRERYTKK